VREHKTTEEEEKKGLDKCEGKPVTNIIIGP
jgi:hypothetical protein